jgi:subtilase family serine protease
MGRSSRSRIPAALLLATSCVLAPGTADAAGAGARSAAPPNLTNLTPAECITDLGAPCYSPQAIRTAYDLAPLYKQGLDGKGVTIAIVDSFGSPTVHSDLNGFDKEFGLPPPPHFQVITPAGAIPRFSRQDPNMSGWLVETDLDVEYAHAIAPGANILLVETPVAETTGTAGFPQIVTAEDYLLDHHMAQVISQSFGTAEATFPSKQALLGLRGDYLKAKADQVTVLAASGDLGPTDYDNQMVPYPHPAVDWPSSDPLVTSVGGTEVSLTPSGRRRRPDSAWDAGNAASGGGRSSVFSRPAWQSAVAGVVGNHRGTPDVAVDAGQGVALYVSADLSPSGKNHFDIGSGTSLSTPVFAGMVAIADQEAGHSLGFLNPDLYRLYGSHSAGIVDVTSGRTSVDFERDGRDVNLRGWPATRGYDLATGIGTIDAALFVPALVKVSEG